MERDTHTHAFTLKCINIHVYIHPSAALNNRKAQGEAIQFALKFALHQLLKTNVKLEPQQ